MHLDLRIIRYLDLKQDKFFVLFFSVQIHLIQFNSHLFVC